jgi:hypothetical protein
MHTKSYLLLCKIFGTNILALLQTSNYIFHTLTHLLITIKKNYPRILRWKYFNSRNMGFIAMVETITHGAVLHDLTIIAW